ncbi:hypothetical protein [Nocardia harenae]|uniref:hypothetical protein n=1 Tax=Nocardia harenae TaxID=358707 RepID=UPI000AD5A469|nr:hypothetical protein [Nocardia harenae]
MWWLVTVGAAGICAVLWWVIHYVGWRDFEPGRHLRGHVAEVQPERADAVEPITDVLPIIGDDSHTTYYDPSFYRLSNAVRNLHQARKTGS